MTDPRPRAGAAVLVALLTLALWPGRALAQPDQTFIDVGPGNPYYDAVEQVSVVHRLMKGYPDAHTFSGTAPLDREEFVDTIGAFLHEIEHTAGVSLADSAIGLYDFSDVADPTRRAAIVQLANRYDLFDFIPASLLGTRTFEPQRPVSRYEAAAVFDALMRLLERKGIIPPLAASQDSARNPFVDLSPDHWAYQPVLDVVRRYGLMIGTTPTTFDGQAVLTRYQFAAIARKAFDRIRAEASAPIVIPRQIHDVQDQSWYHLFHGADPVMISASTLWTTGIQPYGEDGALQWIGYSKLPWSQSPRLNDPELAYYHFGNLYQTVDTNTQDSQGLEIFQNNQFAENLLMGSWRLGILGISPSPLQWEAFVEPTIAAAQISAYSRQAPILTSTASASMAFAAGAGAMLGVTAYERSPEGALDLTLEGGIGYFQPLSDAARPFVNGLQPMVRFVLNSHLFPTARTSVEFPHLEIDMLPGMPAHSAPASPSVPTSSGGFLPGLQIGVGFGVSF